jgi:hypothetical protein
MLPPSHLGADKPNIVELAQSVDDLSTPPEIVPACDVDLTQKGLPVCFQDCAMWCWATVISEFEAYYAKQLGAGDGKDYCVQQECAVVSEVVGEDCCAKLDPSEQGNACPQKHESEEGFCSSVASEETILSTLKTRIPSRAWIHTNSALSEADLQRALLAGSPVGRIVPGHIDAIVGCRSTDRGVEYKVIDSLGAGFFDPDKAFWWSSYTIAVFNSLTASGEPIWTASYHSPSATPDEEDEDEPTVAPIDPTTQQPGTTEAPMTTQAPEELTLKQCQVCLTMCAPCKQCTEDRNATFLYGTCDKCWSCWNFGKDKLKDDDKHMDKDCDAMHHSHDFDDHKVRCLTDSPKSKKVTSDCRPCWARFGDMMLV